MPRRDLCRRRSSKVGLEALGPRARRARALGPGALQRRAPAARHRPPAHSPAAGRRSSTMRSPRSRSARRPRCSRACSAELPDATIVSLGQRPAPAGVHDRQLVLERRTDSAADARLPMRRRWRPPNRPISKEGSRGADDHDQAQLLERDLEPRRGAVPLRPALRRVPGGEEGQGRRRLPLRHRQPPHRRAEARRERLQLRRARHHRLAAGVRRLRRAADQEPAARPHLQGLLRRHLPARCPPAAAASTT